MTEDQLHKSIADYLTVALEPPVWWSTFPAGGGGKVRGARLKQLGLKPGVPDIVVHCPGRAALYIELKRPKVAGKRAGKLSGDQIDTHKDMKAAGCVIGICHTIGEVGEFLRGWQVPMRAVG